jgi:hypothetical protein
VATKKLVINHPYLHTLSLERQDSWNKYLEKLIEIRNCPRVRRLCLLIYGHVSTRSSKKGKLLPVDLVKALARYLE